MKCLRQIGLVTFTLACTYASLAATPAYSVLEIGSLGGYTVAYGMNDNGDIVGAAEIPGGPLGTTHAFVYRHATRSIVDLGTSGGTSSEALSINDSGMIAGEVWDKSDWDPIVWLTSGGWRALDGPYPNGEGGFVSPNAISNTGVIVGTGYINDVAATRAIVYKNNTITNLGTLGGGWSDGFAISSQGIYIAGASAIKGATAATNDLPIHAFQYRNGTRRDLGVLGAGNYSIPAGVNNKGTVVGYSYMGQIGSCVPTPFTAEIQHAFISVNGGKMTDLGTLANKANCSSTAEAINDTGEIVGRSDAITTADPTVAVLRAFLESGGQMYNLSFLDWGDPAWGNVRFTEAVAINCNGWIAANGYDIHTPQVARVYLLIRKGPLRPECPVPK